MKKNKKQKKKNWYYAVKVKNFSLNKTIIFGIERNEYKKEIIKSFKKVIKCKDKQKYYLLWGKINAISKTIIDKDKLKKIDKNKYFDGENILKIVNKNMLGIKEF